MFNRAKDGLFAIGSTENMPGGNAQRPGDIVTAYNGKTIEVLNTDAEGRLVLADVLAYVNKQYEPMAILDFATLTGAVLVALGNRATGIMGNDISLMREVKKASEISFEKVWELPLWQEYSSEIKGKYADIQNIGQGRLAGTITAGAFLKEFVDDTPWVHMDIAGTAWGPKEPEYQPKVGATGVGVRLVYDLLENSINKSYSISSNGLVEHPGVSPYTSCPSSNNPSTIFAVSMSCNGLFTQAILIE